MSLLHRSSRNPQSIGDRLRSLPIPALCLAATALSLFIFHRHYPVQQWLFWRLAAVWAWEGLFVAASLSFGHLLLDRVLRVRDLPGLECAVASMAVGVAAFVICMMLGGAIGMFRPWFAIALPVALLVAGLPAALPRLRSVRLALASPSALSPGQLVLLGAGLLCVAAVYLPLLTPDSLNCDSRWFHLTAAQDYAREGRLFAFEADWAKDLPQLTSILHTWAFLVPGLPTPVRWIMALHTEFVLFLWTLAAIVPAVRWLTHRDGLSASWVAFFLFPAVFVYDSNLGGAADHVLAFFALPLLLAGLRAVERPEPRMALLAGAFAGAGLMTKFQAVYVIAPLGMLMFARAMAASFRVRGAEEQLLRRRAWLSLGGLGVAAVVVFSPHLIKNQVFHGNPVYPFLMSKIATSHPVLPGGDRLFQAHLSHANDTQLLAALWDSLPRPLDFWANSLSDHNSRAMPFLGATCSLLLPTSLLVGNRRLLAAVFVAVAAILAWAVGFPTARNIQTLLPVLVAVTASLVALVWRQGLAARAALSLLISVQVVWGADELFASQGPQYSSAMRLLRSGRDGRPEDRFDEYRSDYRALGKALPRDAVLLLHTTYDQLGIDRRTLLDWPGFQGLIDYRPMRSARDVYQRFKDLGITHIAIDTNWPAHSRQEEVVFDALLRRHAKSLGKHGPLELWAMPTASPPDEAGYRVACLGLTGYPDGIYPVERLDLLDEDPKEPRVPDEKLNGIRLALQKLNELDALVITARVPLEPVGKSALEDAFFSMKYKEYGVYVRQRPRGRNQ